VSTAGEVISLGKLSNVPNLPAHFLPRPVDLNALKNAMLANVSKPVVVTGRTRSIGVHGMGGIGKSVLAAVLARDDEVRSAFPDGVIWLTISQEPAIISRQRQLALALGDKPSAFEDEQQGKAHLSELLADKACLVILDDVWEVKHATAFNVLGPQCGMLVTTRDARIINSLNAVGHCLDVLSDDDALKLLAKYAEQNVETLPESARQVAKECGNLPLALSMLGAMAREKGPARWDGPLHRLQTADLEKIKQEFPDYPYPNLLRAIQVSVDSLEPYLQARYLDFAVFPEDTPVPEAVLQTFWQPEGLDEYDTQDVVDALVNLSLARRDDLGDLNLHDLQFDCVRKQADDLPALHHRLLNAYATRCDDGWSTGPNDGYFFQHLPYHLLEAGRKEELRGLLLNFDWLQAKLTATDANALIGDYDLFADDDDLRLVQRALRLSAHILARYRTQLAGQLIGRLLSFESLKIQVMLERAGQYKVTSWLRPLTPSLTQPGGPLPHTPADYTGWVSSVSVTPDGRFAISASGDKTLKVWDIKNGEVIRTLEGHTSWITSVSVTPDGRFAISASYDKTLKVWELETGKEIRTLEGHTHWVTSVSVTPDGRFAISASLDETLKVWELCSGKKIRTLAGYIGSASSVSVTPDNRFAIFASEKKTLKVCDIKSGKTIRTLVGHTQWIRSVSVTPDGRFAISASHDKTLKVWELETGKEIRTLEGHINWVTSVSVTPDGRLAISVSYDKTLKVWELQSGAVIAAFSADSPLWTCAVAPDGRTIVAGDGLGRVHFLRLEGV